MARREEQTGDTFVDPRLSAEAAYRAGITARKAGGPAKYVERPGGAPTAIPRLDAPHQPGLSMSQQAELVQRATRIAQERGPTDPGSIVEMPDPQQLVQQAPSPANLGILPVDMLPDTARKDPAFIEGYGSMYASAQPNLALKYGVVRNGQHIAPQQLRPQQKQLRPETLKDLETLTSLQQTAPGLHATERDSEAGIPKAAEAAARVGNAIGDDSVKPLTKEEKEKLDDTIKKMDEFDLDSFRQAMMKDILNNPGQKEIIEAKLPPLSLEDLLMHNRVTQRIPVVPSIFEPEFQSMTAEDDLALKRLIMQESKSVEVSDRYLLDKFSFMSIAVGLKSINGKPMGTHEDDKGNFSDEKFWAKFNRILKLPIHMIASIGVNLFWFEARVRKLFVAEKVGNG